jgi:hypothetical protein
MSGSAIPYHLRPHKAVDRRLFLDLLSRMERWTPLFNYAYISMGAYPLEDHKLVHRVLGITKLISFDMDDRIVARQHFNRPIESCRCIKMKSGDMISDLESILNRFDFGNADGLVIWLDYTDPSKLGEQIREFEALLDRLRAGDVVRVTVNAHPQALGSSSDSNGKPIPAMEVRASRFQRLKGRINDYLPSWASADEITEAGFPRVIAASFGAAALKALPVSGPNMFSPLSIIRYADGQQMLSITGAVVARSDEDSLLERLDLKSWPFASLDWGKIHHLLVPDLTVRERLFLERGIMNKTTAELSKELGFEFTSGIEVGEFLDNYRDYYRFYPVLLPADL